MRHYSENVDAVMIRKCATKYLAYWEKYKKTTYWNIFQIISDDSQKAGLTFHANLCLNIYVCAELKI